MNPLMSDLNALNQRLGKPIAPNYLQFEPKRD